MQSITLLNEIPQDKKIILDFHADWCGPCIKIGPDFVALSKQYTDIVFLKVDVDSADEIVQKYNISCMPTFIFINNGEIYKTQTGANLALLKENTKELNSV